METINLQHLVNCLKNITRCAVCLKDLGTSVVQCMSGHTLCSICRSKNLKCPTCDEFFLANQPIMLVQLLEVLPKMCKFTAYGCETICINKAHELVCEFRTINCKFNHHSQKCNWVGSVKDFKRHVFGYHKRYYSTYRSGCPKTFYYKNFKINWQTQYYLHVIDNAMFIYFSHKDRCGKFIQVVKHIPIGNSNPNDYYINICISKQKIIYMHTIKAGIYDETEKLEDSPYCMVVPTQELENFLLPNSTSLEVTFEAIKCIK